jgi:hypothetical protein
LIDRFFTVIALSLRDNVPRPAARRPNYHHHSIRKKSGPTVRRALLTHGVSSPHAKYRETIARAVADIKLHREKGRRRAGYSRRRLTRSGGR